VKYSKRLLSLISILIISGCTSFAPPYQPDFELVNKLKSTDLPAMKTGEFTEQNELVNKITIRGGPMVSPYEKSYAKYLEKALEEELKQSELWDKSSNIVISGTLLINELDGSGISVGESDMSANFIVTKNGNKLYDKTHTIHHEWESSFVGAIAIPAAQNNYPISIQKLLVKFLSDEEFLTIIK